MIWCKNTIVDQLVDLCLKPKVLIVLKSIHGLSSEVSCTINSQSVLHINNAHNIRYLVWIIKKFYYRNEHNHRVQLSVRIAFSDLFNLKILVALPGRHILSASHVGINLWFETVSKKRENQISKWFGKNKTPPLILRNRAYKLGPRQLPIGLGANSNY